MKFYEYSVKDALISYFGDNAILEMRKRQDETYKAEDEKFLTPLIWQYADREARKLFIDANYLLDTIIEDDYIAYLGQFENQKKAYLMFMVSEEKPTFQMDAEYAKEIVEEWENKGFEAYILRERVVIIRCEGKREGDFHFVTRTDDAALYKVKRVNGKYIFVMNYHRCWDYYYRKMVFISGTEDLQEYECLFNDDVEITRGDEENEQVISKGIAAVMDFLRVNPVRIAYSEFKDTKTYSQILISGENELVIHVNGTNQICKIHLQKASGKLIIDEADNSYGSLVGHIPALVDVRLLPPEQMHGYALQLLDLQSKCNSKEVR